MRKVITYGTYDLLHYGHVKLLQRMRFRNLAARRFVNILENY